MSKTILYLVTEDWYFWSHRLSLAEAVKKRGYDVVVVTQAKDLTENIRSKGFVLEPMEIHRSVGAPFSELRTIFNLVRLYKRIKPDLVHHVALKPIISGSVAAWLAGVPRVVNSFTGLGYLFVSRSIASRIFVRIVSPVMSLLLRTGRFYSIVQNGDDEIQLLSLGLASRERTRLIPGSGVDINKFDVSPEPAGALPVVLFASRLLRDKGITEFVNAARLLQEGGIKARFVIAGGMDESNLTCITESELMGWVDQGHIEWWGQRGDMHEVIRQAHIVCLPSYREGLPKVLLEAAACGRPIVATDVPGCREVVEDGSNGYLVPPMDPVSLAEAIRKLLESPEDRRRMGETGRRRVLNGFAQDDINRVTLALYEELLVAP